jgi:hypothetical protein
MPRTIDDCEQRDPTSIGQSCPIAALGTGFVNATPLVRVLHLGREHLPIPLAWRLLMMQRRCSPDVLLTLVPLVAALSACGLIDPVSHDAEAGTSPHDAGADGGQDAASAPSDAASDAEAGNFACTGDHTCSESEYCSIVSHSCSARCDALNGCIGPKIAASNNRIATDGEHICFADDNVDADGPRYVVRSWDGVAPQARTIARVGDARVLLVADGYCYFSSPSLERAPLAGGLSERVQALSSAPRRTWLTTDYVWWAAPRDDLLDVYRLRRLPATQAELVASVPAANLWEGGNSTYLFRRFKPTFASCAIVMAPIADLTAETTIPMSFSKNCSGAFWANEQSVLFTQFEPVHYYPFRVDLDNPGVETTIRLHSQELLMYQVRGSFVYAQSVVDGSSVVGIPNTVSYQRAGLNGSGTERLFTPTPGTASYTISPFEIDDNVQRTFAVLEEKLVYQHMHEYRLVVAPLLTAEADAGVAP